MRHARPMPDPIDVQVGQTIQRRREARGLTLRRLGDAVGLSYQQIQKYERGDNRISASMLVAIGRALSCRATDFLPPEELVPADDAARWLEETVEGRELLTWFQGVPAEFQKSLLTICRALAEVA